MNAHMLSTSTPKLQRLPFVFAGLLVLLYLAGLVWGADWAQLWLAHRNAHGHAHLHAHGHPFVDARSWFGIPNALDTLSNLPFALLALGGAWLQARCRMPLPAASRAALGVLWLGLLLTALGSAVYHWQPTPSTLVADRLGMAVAFAGALSLATSGMLGQSAAWRSLARLSQISVDSL